MTGREVLAQVREALGRLNEDDVTAEVGPWDADALAALDDCVLLTAEERALLTNFVTHHYDDTEQRNALYAILTPEPSDDVGPPPPGEGDDLPNPEPEMKC